MELAIPHRTTKSFFAYDDVVDLQLKKTTAFLELEVDIRSGVERQTMRRREELRVVFGKDSLRI